MKKKTIKKKTIKKGNGEDWFHFKWVCEGLKKWDDVIKSLEVQLKCIKKAKLLGCKILQKVDNGHLLISVPANKIKEYCKYFGMKEEDLFFYLEEEEE